MRDRPRPGESWTGASTPPCFRGCTSGDACRVARGADLSYRLDPGLSTPIRKRDPGHAAAPVREPIPLAHGAEPCRGTHGPENSRGAECRLGVELETESERD